MAAGAVQTEFTGPLDCKEYTRTNVAFRSQGEELDAWLYVPAAKARGTQQLPPIVVMAHGA